MPIVTELRAWRPASLSKVREVTSRRGRWAIVEQPILLSAGQMESPTDNRMWTIHIEFMESADETEAKATLDLGDERLGGWGRARRDPADPHLPRIGEQLAAARALSDLNHRLLDRAAKGIEGFEGHPVHLHV